MRNANAKRVVLTHLYPQVQGHEKEMAWEVGELSGVMAETGWDMMTMIL